MCHCEDCRRVASSDYVSWFGVRRDTLTWQGPRNIFNSSKQVQRSFCKECWSPTSFETDIFPDETHLYALTLDDVSVYQPTAHIFWSERLPWVHPADDLPKHLKGLQQAAQTGHRLME
ncbi:GFA family protein [Kiloniella sp.]|uniref:GFA family protein n=1 Tax=Kiloniella sp. TaxID=1938587 RepID=UPI003B0287CA